MNRIILFLVLLFSPLIQSERAVLTDRGIEFAQWSPTGEIIIYTQKHDNVGKTFRIDAGGGNLLQLPNGESARWSPDGSQIAYILSRVEYSGNDTIYKHSVRLMNADGSQDRAVFETSDYGLAVEWSPDGSKLLVWSSAELFTINPDGSNHVQLTGGETVGSSYTWSPDGQRIAYMGRDATSIWIMNADGSEAMRLISRLGLGGPVWTPDGHSISFSYREGSHYGPGFRIGIVDPNDRSFYDLVSKPTGNPAGFSWSPDGTTLIYADYEEIYRINADGSQEANLTHSPSREWLPAFSPDGSQIAYIAVVDGSDEGTEIYVMAASGANPRRVSINDMDEQSFAWSPDSAHILFVGSQQARTSLHAIAASGGQPTLLTGNVGSFAVAPNEKKVAFTQGGLQDYDVFTVDLDGSGLTRLTRNEHVDMYEWSPDGERLALYLNQKGLYIVAADAVTVTEAARISTQEVFMPIQWSHDGSLIAYSDNANIFTIEPISGTLSQLTTEGIYMFPQWSPTERTLAFFGAMDTGLALFTYALDGTGLKKIVNVWGETPDFLQWSPDGSKIFYKSSSLSPALETTEGESPAAPLPAPTPYFKSYVINAEGGGRVFIRDSDYSGAWTPDGRWLQFGAQLISPDGRTEITLGLPLDRYIYSDWSPDSTHILYLTTNEPGLYPSTTIYVARLNLPSSPP